MARQWTLILGVALAGGAAGCAQANLRPGPDAIALPVRAPAPVLSPEPSPLEAMAVAAEPLSFPPELSGPQPVDVFIRRALVENRTVQAAYHNVQSLRYRIPQVTALDDPVASNAVFPIPSVAPQYFLMGYNPYNLTLAQQFPWFGTLGLRGQAAERDVQVALAELAAAQLDTVATVKRAYYNLFVSQKTDEILGAHREILEFFREITRQRLATGGTQQDVLRSGVMLSELDRELAGNQQALAAARSALSRQLHVRPDSELEALPVLPQASAPAEIERLNGVAIAARPELQGRLAAVARDEKAIDLARKRFYPNLTLGFTYMDMEKTNALAPKTANGMPNLGLFVAFNLPVHQAKYQAGVCEAEERARADARLYEAQRDETYSEIQELFVQARVQQNVLTLLRDGIQPRIRQALELARSDYAKGNVDSATALSAWREDLQVELQIAQVEAELGKALAALERAVGCQINEHPPDPHATPPAATGITPAPPPASASPGSSPFRTKPGDGKAR
jgi:outer membrane protein TolC